MMRASLAIMLLALTSCGLKGDLKKPSEIEREEPTVQQPQPQSQQSPYYYYPGTYGSF